MAKRLKERKGRSAARLAGVACAATCVLAACGGASPSTRSTQSAGQTSAHGRAVASSAAKRSPATAYALRLAAGAPTRQLASSTSQPVASAPTPTAGSARRHATRNATAPRGAAAGPRSQRARVQADLAALPAAGGTSPTPVGEPTGGGGPPLNPCTLVTPSEAQGIVGGPIPGAVERPLGPTCVYQRGNGKRSITLAVELMNYSAITKLMTNGGPITVGNFHAFCGELGATMLLVSLGNNVVLNVSAPCPLAQKFAVIAVRRLG